MVLLKGQFTEITKKNKPTYFFFTCLLLHVAQQTTSIAHKTHMNTKSC